MLLNYIGGAQDRSIKDLSPDQIVQQVHEDVKKILLKPDAKKPRVLGVKAWPNAIPQYNKGHLDIINKVEKATDSQRSGLFLGGNYRTGVAFGDCVAYGAEVATAVCDFITATSSDVTTDATPSPMSS